MLLLPAIVILISRSSEQKWRPPCDVFPKIVLNPNGEKKVLELESEGDRVKVKSVTVDTELSK